MKKGKRQIVQKNVFEDETSAQPSLHQTTQDTHAFHSSNNENQQNKNEPHPYISSRYQQIQEQTFNKTQENQISLTNHTIKYSNQQKTNQSESLKSNTKPNIIKSNHVENVEISDQLNTNQSFHPKKVQSISGDEDKKKKLQLLKLKYLKKNHQNAQKEAVFENIKEAGFENMKEDRGKQIKKQQRQQIQEKEVERRQISGSIAENIIEQKPLLVVTDKKNESLRPANNRVPPPPPKYTKNIQINQIKHQEIEKIIETQQIKKQQGIPEIVRKEQVQNKNLKELLSQKLNKKIPILTQPQKQIQFADPFNVFQSEYKENIEHHQEAKLDEEHKQFYENQKSQNKTFQKTLKIKSSRETYEKWLSNNPREAFIQIFSEQLFDNLLSENPSKKYEILQLHSQSKELSPILKDTIIKFLLKNVVPYHSQQKENAYKVGLEYFYSKSNELSNELLILLIKTGKSYMLKYERFLIGEGYLIKTLQQVIKLKGYYLESEVNELIQLIYEKIDVSQLQDEQLFWLMVLCMSSCIQVEKVQSEILNRNFRNQTITLEYLVFLRNALPKYNYLLGIYLKMMHESLIKLEQYSLLNQALHHLKEVQSTDKYYHQAKQLKLKIINLITQTQSKQPAIALKQGQTTQPVTTKDQKNQKEGFFSYFNKAIDKLKNTAQLIQKQKPKEEQKSDTVTYDPVLKRYLINGKVPDQDNVPLKNKHNNFSQVKSNANQIESHLQGQEIHKKVLPPPPPPSRVNVPPPPARKNRIVTNRYA